MRITYYQFPENLPVRERALAYKQFIEGREDLKLADVPEGMDDKLDENFPLEVDCTVTKAKKLLKTFGGHAVTQHFDRDGGLFETTEVKLRGNNSRHRYNHHL